MLAKTTQGRDFAANNDRKPVKFLGKKTKQTPNPGIYDDK